MPLSPPTTLRSLVFAPTPSEHSSSQLHYYSQLHILVQVSSKFMVVLVYEYGYHASSSFLILCSGGSSAVVGSPLASLGRGFSVLMRRLGWEAGAAGEGAASRGGGRGGGACASSSSCLCCCWMMIRSSLHLPPINHTRASPAWRSSRRRGTLCKVVTCAIAALCMLRCTPHPQRA